MQLHLFDLNLLRTLDTLLQERSVTRSAEKLCITQQGMSGSLKRLREHFGDELLVRVGLRLQLTPLGAALVGPVREVVLQIGMALETTPTFDPATTARRFRVALSDYAAVTFLPLVLERLLATSAGITCDVCPLDAGVFADLEAGNLDLCLQPNNFWSAQVDQPDALRTSESFSDDFVCMVDASHFPAGDAMTPERYLALPHCAVRLGHGYRTIVEDAWLKAGIRPRIAATSTSHASIPFMIVGTPMVATVQRRMATTLARLLPVRLLECPCPIAPLRQELSWHRRHDLDPAHRFVRDAFKAAAAALDEPSTIQGLGQGLSQFRRLSHAVAEDERRAYVA